MRKKITVFIICLVFIALFSSPLVADVRNENIDIYLLLDKSLSMEELIGSVKEYVNTSILDQLVIPGDFLVIIGFYGDTEILVSQDIKSRDDIEQIKKRLATVKGDGRFTDIGGALDTLKKTLENHKDRGRKRYLLLMTDGIQEAPKMSLYFSPDGTFNHAFLENARTIQKEGWKIQILGIGTATAAKEIAESLAGEYKIVPEDTTPEEFAEKTKDILGIIQLKGTPKFMPVGKSGVSQLTFKLSSSGYVERKNVYVDRIEFEADAYGTETISISSFIAVLDPEMETTVTQPVHFSNDFLPGTVTGNLIFVFGGDTVFTPAVVEIAVTFRGFFLNNIWILPAGLVILAALIILIRILIIKRKGGLGLQIRIYVDNKPIHKEPVSLKEGLSAYLEGSIGNLALSETESEKTIASLKRTLQTVQIIVRNEKDFPLVEAAPDNILGLPLKVKSLAGGYRIFLVKAV